MNSGFSLRAACWFLRISLAAGFLSAVVDRFGLWGASGTEGVVWGDWQPFLDYVALLHWFAPPAAIPAPGWAATIAEILLALGLLGGWQLGKFATLSSLLLLQFALMKTLAFNIKSALDYSVFGAAAGAFLLAVISRDGHEGLPNSANAAAG